MQNKAISRYILNFFMFNNKYIFLRFCKNYSVLINLNNFSQKELLWFFFKEYVNKINFYQLNFINFYYLSNMNEFNNNSVLFNSNLSYIVLCYFYGVVFLGKI